jgi:hypothetical protein
MEKKYEKIRAVEDVNRRKVEGIMGQPLRSHAFAMENGLR